MLRFTVAWDWVLGYAAKSLAGPCEAHADGNDKLQKCEYWQPRKRDANRSAQTVSVTVPLWFHSIRIGSGIQNENLSGPGDANNWANCLDNIDAPEIALVWPVVLVLQLLGHSQRWCRSLSSEVVVDRRETIIRKQNRIWAKNALQLFPSRDLSEAEREWHEDLADDEWNQQDLLFLNAVFSVVFWVQKANKSNQCNDITQIDQLLVLQHDPSVFWLHTLINRERIKVRHKNCQNARSEDDHR